MHADAATHEGAGRRYVNWEQREIEAAEAAPCIDTEMGLRAGTGRRRGRGIARPVSAQDLFVPPFAEIESPADVADMVAGLGHASGGNATAM